MSEERFLDSENTPWETAHFSTFGKKEKSKTKSNTSQIKIQNLNNGSNNSNNHNGLSSKEIRKLVQQKHSIRKNSNNDNNHDNDDNNDNNDNNYNNNNNANSTNMNNNSVTNIDDIFGIFTASITQDQPQQLQHQSTSDNNNNNNNNDFNYSNPFINSDILMFDTIGEISTNNNNRNKIDIDPDLFKDFKISSEPTSHTNKNKENNEKHGETMSTNKKKEISNNEKHKKRDANHNDEDDEDDEDDNEVEDESQDEDNSDDSDDDTDDSHDVNDNGAGSKKKQITPDDTVKGIKHPSWVPQSLIKENKQQRSPSLPSEGAKKMRDVLPELKRGAALLKYGRHGFPHFRQVNLSADNSKLIWYSISKKMDETAIEIKDIKDIITGQHTKEFRRMDWVTLSPASFSIIYAQGSKSLNLVAKTPYEMKMWVDGLRKLRELQRKGENLPKLTKLEIEIDVRDGNPRKPSNSEGNVPGRGSNEGSGDPAARQKLLNELASLKKIYEETTLQSFNTSAQASSEFPSIQQILSELEQRIETLKEEVPKTQNIKAAQKAIWRATVDTEAVRDKIQVLIQENAPSKRKWIVF